jgi:acetyl esterase
VNPADASAGAVHPAIQAVVEAEIAAGAPEPTLDEARAAYLQTAIELGGDPVAVGAVTDRDVPRPDGGSVPVRVYRPLEPPLGLAAALIWFHGGGWVLGNLDGFDRVARQLANASGALCVSVDYRLAPEAPFPAAIEDADAVVAWVTGAGAAELGVDPGRVAVGGDSSGGQVAAVAALHGRERVMAQLLVYPALDPAMASAAYTQYADGPMLTAGTMRMFWDLYRAGRPADDPDLDVARADLAGAPPAWIATAAHDPLRDDGPRYGVLLEAAGVPVTSRTSPAMTHGFLRWGGIVDEAHDLIAWLGGAVRQTG